jgi:hypothetical protein
MFREPCQTPGTRAGSQRRRPHPVSAGAPGSGQLPPVTVPAGRCGGVRTLLSGKAERFGMGPPVVLGQRLAEGARPVGHGRWQISQWVSGSWVTVTGKRRVEAFASMMPAPLE